MRTLNVAELKNLMHTHECNLVHCHTNNLWTIENNSNDDIEYVSLDNDAVELIAIWVKEDAVAHYLSESSVPEDFGKEIYDAWRSVQAYGKQPHSGYLKATEHGIQRNTEHFEDGVEQMEEYKREEH
ncbi:hypothetical protein A9Q74_08610 [Colwellia sp. 39_35_sub15_T18]|nr:hypothetical protein A9Q74_08610 [Colwellia sp. 39_35_sub15_T18]